MRNDRPTSSPPTRLYQPRGRFGRATGGEHVVHDQDALSLTKCVLVNLEPVDTVFEGVVFAMRLGWQLPRLANRDEPGIQTIGDGRAENEAAALDADDLVDALRDVRRCQAIDHFTKSLRIVQERRDVVEQNPWLGKIRNMPDLGLEMLHVVHVLVDRKSQISSARHEVVDFDGLDACVGWTAA